MSGRLDEVWAQVLHLLKGRVQQPSYGTWLQPTSAVDLRGNTLIVRAPHRLAKEQLESHYTELIKSALTEVIGGDLDLEFVVMDPTEQDKKLARKIDVAASLPRNTAQVQTQTILNPKYTFDSFVVGNSNRFAHAAALAVAESPGNAYNPLFIYGGVGLGKTHLMQAIAHYILGRDSSARVVYVSCEAFLNEMIAALSRKDMAVFKSKYRKCRRIDDRRHPVHCRQRSNSGGVLPYFQLTV